MHNYDIKVICRLFIFILFLFEVGQVYAAIFGIDNRRLVEPSSPQKTYSRAIAVSVLNSFVTDKNKKLDISVENTNQFLCQDEKFYGQPSIDYACTAFLVGPDLLATAGHCVVNTGVVENDSERYCESYHWVFDYQSNSKGITETQNLASDNLYKCKRIIFGVNQERFPFQDFALIQLDRPVLDREPLKLSNTNKIQGPFSMIGHPFGIPAVFSHGAQLLENDLTQQNFITSLDAFEGNSGSPVFDASMKVVGILISGTPEPHLIKDKTKDCFRYNTCRENGKNCKNKSTETGGSDVQRIEPLKEIIESLNVAS